MGQNTNTYIALFSGVSLIFYFTGLVDSNPFIDILLRPQNLSTSSLYLAIFTAIAGVAAVIVIGFSTKNSELAVMSAVTAAMIPVLWNFTSVFLTLYEINEVLALLFFAPLMFLFVMNIVDYWRGRD